MQKKGISRHLLHHEPSARWARLYLGCFFVIAAVSQLFAFEEYPALIASYGTPLVSDLSVLTAITIILVEIAAVPALIGMSLSQTMKIWSERASWIGLLFWLFVGLWQALTVDFIPNAGLFGTKVLLPQGWWLVSFITALIVLYLFASCYRPKKP